MNKKIVWFIVIALGIIFAAGAYVLFVGKDTPMPESSGSSQPSGDSTKGGGDDTPVSSDDEKTTQPGAYVDYSEEAVLATPGEKLIFFHAPWCPQCRAVEADIKATTLPDNLTIFKVDYDSNQALRQKYGVTIQTTFVEVDDNGNKIESFVAYDEPTFEAVQRELLE